MPTLLTGTEAIKYLNQQHLKISRSTFYRMVRDGKIVPHAIPGLADPRYKQEDLDALFTPAPKEEAGDKEG